MNIDEDKKFSLIGSLKAGHYNLLLGSGVSLDSENILGPLLSADELRLDLCGVVNAKKSSTLQRVFSELSSEQIKKLVLERYQYCKPGPSLVKINKFLWKNIFTFNIDDAVEAAYSLSFFARAKTTPF